MKILFVWDGDYPWDIRVEKVCKSLHKDSHEVHMVCRNIARRPLSDTFNNIIIHRLPSLPHWLGSLNNAFTFPAFFSPLWLWRIYQQAKENKCDLIIVRDLPMALAGIWVAKLLKIPCILDMAECYPEMLRCTRKFEGPSIKNIFLRNPKLADWVEKLVMKDIDQVWVMIEESNNRLINMGVPKDKIRIVSNTPEIDRFLREPQVTDKQQVVDNRYQMIYVGLLNPSRGLDTVIRAVGKYVKINPNFHLKIVGKGKAENEYRLMVNEMGLSAHIEFLGWVENTQVPKLIASSNVGIVSHHKCSHWDNTIPNKLFDYMAAKKPVIVSNVIPMQRIVNMTNCGRVYQDYDDDDLCDVIHELSDPILRDKLAQNGIDEILNTFNWNREEKILLSAVSSLSTT